ncbi:MAG: glycosyltransferase 36, partial [Bacteroidetes bacterium]|nr:glycosyltransferase 36 [Bacteroidota bacterium]
MQPKPGGLKTKYGGFSQDGREYVITRPATPRPWINVMSNGDYGVAISQAGSGYSWRTHAQLNRITRWEQDLIRDEWGKYIYVRDEAGRVWSAGWKPVCSEPDSYRCRHGVGYTRIESRTHGIATDLLVFVPNDEPLELWQLTVTNASRRARSLRLFT